MSLRSSGLRCFAALQFGLDHDPQGRQRPFHGFPYKLGRDVFIIMAINVSRACHLLPADSWMPRLQIIRSTTRSFGDDLQTPRDGVHGLDVALEGGAVEPCREVSGEFDVMQDIAKGGV